MTRIESTVPKTNQHQKKGATVPKGTNHNRGGPNDPDNPKVPVTTHNRKVPRITHIDQEGNHITNREVNAAQMRNSNATWPESLAVGRAEPRGGPNERLSKRLGMQGGTHEH